MGKRRLDTLLAERGLFPSRSRAAASVMAGEVLLGPGRRRASKPGELVEPDEQVNLKQRPQFVSRGGIKLANALAASGLQVAGRRALDVGCATGGFTDCLLQRDAQAVIALDVARGALAWGLRSDPRVQVMEGVNARALRADMLPYPPDLAVVDVSFISLAKVLVAVLGCMAGGYDVLALVKPQFEVGRELVGKGGVVRRGEDRRAALVAVGRTAIELGAAVVSYHPSGLPGPKGNRETFIWLADPARGPGRAAAELERIAREVEP